MASADWYCLYTAQCNHQSRYVVHSANATISGLKRMRISRHINNDRSGNPILVLDIREFLNNQPTKFGISIPASALTSLLESLRLHSLLDPAGGLEVRKLGNSTKTLITTAHPELEDVKLLHVLHKGGVSNEIVLHLIYFTPSGDINMPERGGTALAESATTGDKLYPAKPETSIGNCNEIKQNASPSNGDAGNAVNSEPRRKEGDGTASLQHTD